jgi:Cupin-like domain
MGLLPNMDTPRVLSLSSSSPAEAELAALGQRWASSGAFSPSVLAHEMSLVSPQIQVKAARSRSRFMYYETGNQRMVDPSGTGPPEVVDVSPGEFFALLTAQDLCQQNKEDEEQRTQQRLHYYFTSEVSRVLPDAFLRDRCAGWESLRAERVAGGFPTVMHTFMGGLGSGTQAHYDTPANMFVQVHGRKRFRLWAPADVGALHVYPDAHPLARKSQVDLEHVDFDRFPLVRELSEPHEVILDEGDVLYIPPFFVHHVEPLGVAVSLPVFSESSVRVAAAKCLARLMPFTQEEAADPGRASALFDRLVLNVVGEETAGGDAAGFVGRMFVSRYRPLPTSSSEDDDRPTFHRVPAQTDSIDADLERWLAQYVSDVRGDLQRLRSLPGSESYLQGVVDVTLGHLVELWAVSLFGPRHVGEVLRSFVGDV